MERRWFRGRGKAFRRPAMCVFIRENKHFSFGDAADDFCNKQGSHGLFEAASSQLWDEASYGMWPKSSP